MKEAQLSPDGDGSGGEGPAKTSFNLLDCIGGEEESYAQTNRKRRLLTFEAFKDTSMHAKAVALDSLIKPNTRLMQRLFERTKCIAQITKMSPSLQDEKRKLEEKFRGLCRNIFLYSDYQTIIFFHHVRHICCIFCQNVFRAFCFRYMIQHFKCLVVLDLEFECVGCDVFETNLQLKKPLT